MVGTNTFGKGLVQEVEPLSNGGVLDLTVANYYLPGGKTIGQQRDQAAGQGARRHRDRARRGAARRTRRRARRAPVSAAVRGAAAPAASTSRSWPCSRSAAASWWPSRCSAAARAPRSSAAGPDEGDLVLVGAGKRGARVVRRLGRPDVARDVLEGLMLDRGLHRSYPRAASAEAEGAVDEPYAADARVDLHRPAHVHDRPRRRPGLRRRHLGPPRGRPRAASGCTSPT